MHRETTTSISLTLIFALFAAPAVVYADPGQQDRRDNYNDARDTARNGNNKERPGHRRSLADRRPIGPGADQLPGLADMPLPRRGGADPGRHGGGFRLFRRAPQGQGPSAPGQGFRQIKELIFSEHYL